MNLHIRKTVGACLLGLVSVFCQSAFAIKANPRAVPVRQPDGSTLMIRLHGDESHHYVTTLDGYRIATDSKGFYRYVDYDVQSNRLLLTDLLVHNLEHRTAEESGRLSRLRKASVLDSEWRKRNKVLPMAPARILDPSVVNPTMENGGQRRVASRVGAEPNESQYLCVLVNFADCKMKFKNENFNNFLNAKGYDGYGSVKDYFRDNSGGKFVPNFHTVGPYTLPLPQSSYANNDYETGSDIDPRQMVVDALKLVREKNPDLNFKQFDNDGDGYMDNVYIIYAGYSEASTGNAADMWPHSWTLADESLKYDGIIVKNYSCSQELVGSPEMSSTPSMDGIGTFTHEFGHVLGLKDMYDTDDYYDGKGIDPGAYSLYASGSYNNDSKTPAGLWAFERLQMGWMTEGKDILELKGGEDVTQPNSNESFTARYINCQPNRRPGTGYEWFILENRQLKGWDAFIPGHGLLIYHYDYTNEKVTDCWDYNGPNNNARHRCLYIKAADGIDDDNTRSGDTYPGSSANTSFTDFTTPAALNWAGQPTNVPVTNIQERDGIIYYQAAGGATRWNVIRTLPPLSIHDTQLIVGGEVLSHNTEVKEVGFCWVEGTAEPTTADSHQSVTVSDAPEYTISGLKPGTLYTYKAYMVLTDGTVVYGSPMNTRTEYATAYAPFKEDFNSWTNGQINGWEILDRNSDGVTWMYDKQSKSICYQFDYWNNADDWLIGKRRYHIPENGHFYFKRGVSEEQYVESVEVYVSTKTCNIEDFYLHQQFSIADNFGQSVYEEVDLSMYAGQDVYIALRCNSEKSQGLLRIWDVRLEQKLATPEITYFGKGDNADQFKIQWDAVPGAGQYYLYLGRETEKTYTAYVFTPLSFYEATSQNVELGTGYIFFKGTGFVELMEQPEGYEDLKFMLYPTGPVGVSYLEIEGSTDGQRWEPICPRVVIGSYDSEGIECDYADFVKDHHYTRIRFRFTDNGRLCRLRYLTVAYNDGFVWEQMAAGSVKTNQMTVNAKTPGEFNTGSYVTWVASGTTDGLYFDQSETSRYPKEVDNNPIHDANSIEEIASGSPFAVDAIYGLDGIRRQQLQPGLNLVRKSNGKSYIIYK